MPIDYRIDSQRGIVFIVPEGVLGIDEIVAYQREAASKPAAQACDELVDMSGVREFQYESQEQMRKLIALAMQNDRPGTPPARMAIVAPDDLTFGMARMYGALRESSPGSNKEVEVFRDYDEALRWLERRL